MRKNRKTLVFLLLLSVALLVCACFTGCQEKANGILFAKGDEPRSTYVVGQALDLSKGQLTVQMEKEDKTVALDSPEVSITGYDANKLGQQELTVTYDGFSTTFTVKVVERLTVTNFKEEYIIGESFNQKGTVTLTKDDGSQAQVPMKDAKVTGFDSSAASDQLTLTVTYQSYSTTFQVAVKKAESVEFQFALRDYYSHDTKIDVSGGKVTYKVDGKYETVSMTDSMVTGFNPSAVTAENLEVPVTQEITVSYAGESKTYTINVYYSAVSLIRELAPQMDVIHYTWDENHTYIVTHPDEVMGPKAVEAMIAYFKLSGEAKSKLSAEEKDAVVRHAMVYAALKFNDLADALKVVKSNGAGGITMVPGSLEDYRNLKNIFQDETSDFMVYNALLLQLQAEFSGTVVIPFGEDIDQILLGSYPATPCRKETINALLPAVELLMELYDALSVIPTDWTAADLQTAEAAEVIEAVVEKITASGYNDYNFAGGFEILSQWREKDDFFEIIYSHYYNGGEAKRAILTGVQDPETFEWTTAPLFYTIPMPGRLHVLFGTTMNAFNLCQQYEQYANYAIWADTIQIHIAYETLMDLQEDIEKNGTELEKALYDLLQLPAFVTSNVVFVPSGYIFQVYEMFGDADFMAIWEKYLHLFDFINDSGILNTEDEEVRQALAEAFDALVQAPPSLQYSFIASLFNRYREVGGYTQNKQLAFAYTKDQLAEANSGINTFVRMFASYFNQRFSYQDGEEYKDYMNAQYAARYLFQAIELYALHEQFDTTAHFREVMELVMTAYADMAGEEKAIFDELLGPCYEKYVSLYNCTGHTGATDWGALAPKVQELKAAVDAFLALEADIRANGERGDILVDGPKLLEAYEKVAALAKQIMAEATAEQLCAFYNDLVEYSDGITCSLEHLCWLMRELYVDYLVAMHMGV